ncbi:MAG: hypothetical protein JWN76_3359 [Chitinophagaceae bacterium]|nr:hypothetical protein [Chitinophagaceae bacterium]
MKVSFLIVFSFVAYTTNAQEIHVKKQAVPAFRLAHHPNWLDSLNIGRSQNFDLLKPGPQTSNPDNMPVAGQNLPQSLMVEKNKNGFMVYESPIDHMRGIKPGKENVLNMPVVGSTLLTPAEKNP